MLLVDRDIEWYKGIRQIDRLFVTINTRHPENRILAQLLFQAFLIAPCIFCIFLVKLWRRYMSKCHIAIIAGGW